MRLVKNLSNISRGKRDKEREVRASWEIQRAFKYLNGEQTSMEKFQGIPGHTLKMSYDIHSYRHGRGSLKKSKMRVIQG